MPAKKIVRSKRSTAAQPTRKVAKPAPSPKPTVLGSPYGAGAAVVAIIGIVVLALLFEARNSSAPAYADEPSSAVADSPAPASIAPTPASTAPTPELPRPTPPKPTASKAAPSKELDAPSSPTPAPSPLVTIAGCVDREDRGFRLTDTSGGDAPKSRSWKSGFLKKGSAPIALVDSNSVMLGDHVGRRVSVTGTLSDRQMRVHSLRRVSASCK